MIKKILYIARSNFHISGGYQVYQEPPIKLFSRKDASVCWSGGDGENGRLLVCYYALERFVSILEIPQATCIKVEVCEDKDNDFASIKVLDRNFNCKMIYCDGRMKMRS